MKNIHHALPPLHRQLWAEFETIRKDEVKRGMGWKYEADPFAAVREREAAQAAAAAARQTGNDGGKGNGNGGAGKKGLDPLKGWGKVPVLDMSGKRRAEVEGMIRRYHVWNPMGKVLSDDDRSSIITDMVIKGFRQAHVEEAVEYVKDEQEALEWLLIHVPEDDIPPRFLPEGYKAGISVQAGESLQMEYAARRLAQAGYSMDLCLEVLENNSGSETRAAEALMQILVHGKQLTPTGATEEDLISFDDPTEDSWDEEQSTLEAIYGEERFTRKGDNRSRILLEIANRSEDILPPKIFLEATRPTSFPGAKVYPDALPTFSVSFEGEPKLPSQVKLSIIRQTAEYAMTLLGDAMVFNVVEWLENKIAEIVKNPGRLKDVASAVTGSDESHEQRKVSERVRKKRQFRRSGLVKAAGTPRSMQLLEEYQARMQNPKQIAMMTMRQKLPAWQKKEDIVSAIDQYQVVIISGETGSGKSTQSVQFILDSMIQRKLGETVNIICTQPRRISALGLADRVSEERCSEVGQEIGYSIRGESKHTRGVTKCTFVTTGVLLRRMQMGDRLEDITHVVIDEVHERSLDTDFLLVLVRKIITTNPDLRVVLMSATLDADIFSDYFGGPQQVARIHIEGRTFPVTDYYLDDVIKRTGFTGGGRFLIPGAVKPTESDGDVAESSVGMIIRGLGDNINYNLITATVIQIDKELGDKDGAILIFLPGTMEISRCIDAIKCAKESRRFHLLPLHASLPSSDQRKVFPPPPKGLRKIIAATNVAETSITIEDVVAVIDTGKVKETSYDAQTSVVKLTEVWASIAASKQRRGRAGRVRAGHCYKLYTRALEKSKMPERPEPEMRRVPLEQTCLGVKAMGIKDVRGFLAAAITPPSTVAVEAALKILTDMGAVVDEELTALGKHMSMIPADLRCSKLLIYGVLFGAVDAALTIAAILSTKSPFVYPPPAQRDAAKSIRKSFSQDSGDIIADMKAWEMYQQHQQSGMPIRERRKWCDDNFLGFFTLSDITSNRHQLLSALRESDFLPPGRQIPDVFNNDKNNIPLIRALIAGAFTPQIARIQLPDQKFAATNQGSLAVDPEARMIKYFTVDGRVFLHNSCTLFDAQSFASDTGFLAFFSKFEMQKVFVKECTPVGMYALLLLGGKIELDMMGRGITVDGWLRLRGWGRIGVLVLRLRAMLDDALERMVEQPGDVPADGMGKEVVQLVKRLIATNGM